MQLKPAILSQFCFVIKQVISKYIIHFIRSVAETKMMNKIQKLSKEKNHNLKIRNECELTHNNGYYGLLGSEPNKKIDLHVRKASSTFEQCTNSALQLCMLRKGIKTSIGKFQSYFFSIEAFFVFQFTNSNVTCFPCFRTQCYTAVLHTWARKCIPQT